MTSWVLISQEIRIEGGNYDSKIKYWTPKLRSLFPGKKSCSYRFLETPMIQHNPFKFYCFYCPLPVHCLRPKISINFVFFLTPQIIIGNTNLSLMALICHLKNLSQCIQFHFELMWIKINQSSQNFPFLKLLHPKMQVSLFPYKLRRNQQILSIFVW